MKRGTSHGEGFTMIIVLPLINSELGMRLLWFTHGVLDKDLPKEPDIVLRIWGGHEAHAW